jgi:hypothetical protein
VNEVKTGDKVDLVVLRKGKKVDVKGVEMPEPAKHPAVPQLPRFPELPVPGAFPDLPNGRPFVPPVIDGGRVRPGLPKPIGLPAGFNSVNYTTTNNEFTLKASKPGTNFVVSGTLDVDGAPAVSKVVIERDGREQTFGANEKLPADVKSDVDTLLKTVGR